MSSNGCGDKGVETGDGRIRGGCRTRQQRSNERPGQVAVQGQHGVVDAPVVRRRVGVHHKQLPPQVVPVGPQRRVRHLRWKVR